jgi:redox-sensitive bicupin YhaK (pirin superfamily)
MTNAAAPRIQRAEDRAFFDHGWLKTHHSFSFAEYFDSANVHWGALRVFNDDTVAPGSGFGTHPHHNMEILTYVLEGELAHRDSMKNEGIVRAGGVQYMSAGIGVTHSEENHSKTAPLHFVQMWVLPRSEGLPPSYGQEEYTLEDRRNRWLPIATGESEVTSRIAIAQDATAYVARLESSRLTRQLGPKRLGFLFVAEGRVALDGNELSRGDAARLTGPATIEVVGDGELILWDVPEVEI